MTVTLQLKIWSLPTRAAWIEIVSAVVDAVGLVVAAHTGSVD